MGYQESWLYIEPQRHFNKLIRAYEQAEQEGYYKVAGAEPRSVVVLKQPFGNIPAGTKVLWVCGERDFQTVGGLFAGKLRCGGKIQLIPIEDVLDGPCQSENEYMKRYSAANYAHRIRVGLER